jgi:hypothetical protein
MGKEPEEACGRIGVSAYGRGKALAHGRVQTYAGMGHMGLIGLMGQFPIGRLRSILVV